MVVDEVAAQAKNLAKRRLSGGQKRQIRGIAQAVSGSVPLMPLSLLAAIHGTDKLDHGYIPHYQSHLASLRHKRLTLLEIGVGGYDDPESGGQSLRMWRDYFHRGRIFGLDIVDKSPHDADRIQTVIGDQNDPDFLRSLVASIGPIDIVIDDGSHVGEHMVRSFLTLFPLINDGAMYVIEDLCCSYWPEFQTGIVPRPGIETGIDLIGHLVEALHYQYIPLRRPTELDTLVTSVSCYPKIVFISKGRNCQQLLPFLQSALSRAEEDLGRAG